MATEYIRPGIRQCYEYQPNVLMCWAAVGLTLWRSRHGRAGRGRDMDALMRVPQGARYAQILDYATELNAEMSGGTDLGDLPRAEGVVRAGNPQYVQVPSGLPSTWANNFFTSVIGTRSTSIGTSTTRDQMKTLIRASSPLAIFTTQPGHLKLIVGFWDGGPGDPQSPQIIMFNPEAYIHAARSAGYGEATMRGLREERVLWSHWQTYYAPLLVDSKCWHY
jgi:hypothetical protein